MGTMQTAVEWFEGVLAIFLKDIIENKNYVLMEHLFKEAKRKEEINIKKAFNDGRVTGVFKKIKNSDDYYNETYGETN